MLLRTGMGGLINIVEGSIGEPKYPFEYFICIWGMVWEYFQGARFLSKKKTNPSKNLCRGRTERVWRGGLGR
jgi:hypothetical protein